MPEQISGEFNQAALEADIRRLALEVQQARERPESKGLSEQELLRQSIKAFTPAPQPQSSQSFPRQTFLPKGLENAPAEAKLEIEYLVDIALKDGLDKANAEAGKADPFVLDAFHDMLAGKLYPEFKKRGILK